MFFANKFSQILISSPDKTPIPLSGAPPQFSSEREWMKLLARVAAWGRRRLRACLVARTGPHRATLMHHFLSDACRVCLAGRYGHMPSDKTIDPATPFNTFRPDAVRPDHSAAATTPSAVTCRRGRADCLQVRTVPHCLTHHFLSDACIVALRDATARFQERRRRLRHQQGDR